MLRNVPFTTRPRGPRRWLLIRGDLDQNGHLHRAGVAHLVARTDGHWEWRAAGRGGVAETRETAEQAIVEAWVTRAPVVELEGLCDFCGDALPAGSTKRRRFCSAGCRVSWNRAGRAETGQAVRVRATSSRRTLGKLERLAARARSWAQVQAEHPSTHDTTT